MSKSKLCLFAATSALVLVVATGCAKKEEAPPPAEPAKPAEPPKPEPIVVKAETKAIFGALPERYDNPNNPITDEKVTLGKMLYFDARLSKNHDVSCNSCHGLETYGVDNKPTSPGHKGQLGGRNSPTVYNAGAHMAQFWDGRAKDLEEQALGPVMNPVEMAMKDEKSVLAVLNSMPEYQSAFKAAFPDEKAAVSFVNMGKAIAAFERTLVTPSRFDAFIKGDDAALTDDEKKGMNTFVEVGCVTCHMGAHLGGSMYQKVGLVKPWPNQADLGRFDVTKNDADKFMFRVPTLRNIEKTAPYFHDGQTASLDEAVKMMASHQLGRELTAEQTTSIVTFLKALTGELPKDKIAAPELPKSTAKTPKPDPA